MKDKPKITSNAGNRKDIPGRAVEERLPEPIMDDVKKCAGEVSSILRKYNCTIVPRTIITYNKVEQSVDIIPMRNE
jgi:hypothetical protein